MKTIHTRGRVALAAAMLVLAVAPRMGWGADAASSVGTASKSPIGMWRTFDDKTGKAKAIVRIYEEAGKLFGRIEQSFVLGADRRTCVPCTDERKGQPIIGLLIIRNMKRDGNEYNGGDVLDPESGSVYHGKMHLEDNGTRLVLRGYIGISLFGRSQTWERQK